MKKLILVLVIALIASQSFGALSVYLDRNGTGTTPAVVDLKYSGADVNNLPRAFALKIKINNTALIDSVTGYKTTGESTSGSKGYGIYPARIAIESNGTVTSYGTPLADSADPGAGGGEDTNNVVLEFGSLYFGDTNAPATSGTLCTLNIIQNTAVGSSTVTLEDEDVYRAGLVFEDGTQGNTSDSEVVTWAAPPPGPATNPGPADAATKVYKLTDLSWTAGSGATSHDVYYGTVNPPPLIGNQAGTTYDTGTMALKVVYYWRINEINSGGTTTGAVWSFTSECFPGISTDAKYVQWNNTGKMDCWCAVNRPRQCHGDADGISEGKSSYYTYTNDLNILKSAWGKNYAQVSGLSGGSPSNPLICADFDHLSEGKSSYRVYTTDLNILKTYWGKASKPDPNCANAPWYF